MKLRQIGGQAIIRGFGLHKDKNFSSFFVSRRNFVTIIDNGIRFRMLDFFTTVLCIPWEQDGARYRGIFCEIGWLVRVPAGQRSRG